jgi:pimeloyl-ACP methyl ester carboxylesterase
MNIPHFDLGGIGEPLHFLHANGYPPGCYKPFLKPLRKQYHVLGMLLRPLWPDANPSEIQNWNPFSEDLLRFLDSSEAGSETSAKKADSTRLAPVIGVGHSIGAVVTLRAALKDPNKFRALILLDPVLFVPSKMVLWNLFRSIGLGGILQPNIYGALKRRRTFDHLDLVFRGYRSRNVFRYMSDDNLRIYIDGITHRTKKGYELVYSPEWESRIYATSLQDFDIWNNLPKLEVPTVFIRGAETDTFLESAAMFAKQKQPNVRVETLAKSTHLLPLERPQEVYDLMQSFLDSLESDSLLPKIQPPID